MIVPTLPISGKIFRVAPAQAGQLVASFWKFWIEGNELYAMNRDASSMKISVHASGQTHLRMERRDLHPLFPPFSIAGSDWLHALEIRYLVAPDRFRPTPKKLKKKEKAYLIDVPNGHALILNLLLTSTAPMPGLPTQFGGARTLWVATLTDGRHVTLIGRVMPLDAENEEHLARLRGADGPKVTFDEEPTAPHLELCHVFWGPGGNIVLIVPAGSEAIRTLGKPASLEQDAAKRRQPEIPYMSPDGFLTLHAPNGEAVAELVLKGDRGHVKLSKNEHVIVQMGQLTLTIFDERLHKGECFEVPPLSFSAIPSINGRSPLEWNYYVRCAYDGINLTVVVRPSSTSLMVQSSDSDSPLLLREQVLLTVPSSEITLNASPSSSHVSAALNAKLLLCDVLMP
jgi:hypothetical protein